VQLALRPHAPMLAALTSISSIVDVIGGSRMHLHELPNHAQIAT